MTPEKFRQLALSLPDTSLSEHDDRMDFDVLGENFSSLFPKEGWAVVKLTPEIQSELVAQASDVFMPCKGAWGRNGATIVSLQDAEEGNVLRAVTAAWQRASNG